MFQTNGSNYTESTSKMTHSPKKVMNSSLEIHTHQRVQHSVDLVGRGKSFGKETRANDLRKRLENYLSDSLNKEVQVSWNSPDQVEVKGANSFDLHRFVLEMEKEGRQIEFVKTITIKISL
jgi:hypothetical protein